MTTAITMMIRCCARPTAVITESMEKMMSMLTKMETVSWRKARRIPTSLRLR